MRKLRNKIYFRAVEVQEDGTLYVALNAPEDIKRVVVGHSNRPRAVFVQHGKRKGAEE